MLHSLIIKKHHQMESFMKIKKVIISSLFITITSITTVAQADGFLSKLFAGKEGDSANFATMISHVPADSAYLFTNRKPIPDEVMDFHIKRAQDTFAMVAKVQAKNKPKKEGNDKTDKAGAFLKAIMEDLSSKLSNGKIEESGLSLKATSLIYGYQETPIMRISIADKEKILATIKRAEEKSGYKLELSKCGEFDCLKNTKNKKDDMDMALVLLKNQLAMSIFPIAKQEAIINHLTGKADPKKPFSEEKWDAFLKENSYTGYGDGFVNLKKLYQLGRPLLVAGIQQDSKTKMTDTEVENCMAVADEHLENMSEIIFGTKKLQAKNMDYELVFKTSTAVSNVLQGIANETNIAKRSANPIFDLGLNINFLKLRDAITTYSNFLIGSGKKHKCVMISEKDIRKSMGGLMMVMNMGLTQFKSIYLSLDDLELDKKMQPSKLDAHLSIGTDDPAGLIGMVGMLSPALRGFEVPTDGTPVKLPAGAIPSRGLPLPPLSISRGEKVLNIMVGTDKPVLIDYKSEKPEIMSLAIDGKRYYEIFANIMKALPKPKNAAKGSDNVDALKMMETMGGMMGSIKEEITTDQRGLVVNYHIQY